MRFLVRIALTIDSAGKSQRIPPVRSQALPAQSRRLTIRRVWFRPRILRDVSSIDYSTSILGFKTSMPVYITATALGECNLYLHILSLLRNRQARPSRGGGRPDPCRWDAQHHPNGESPLPANPSRAQNLPDSHTGILLIRRDGRCRYSRSDSVHAAVGLPHFATLRYC